ncbi:nucleoside 2-deoxyribosyltransferase [Patescibacteria group bacterium]
MKAYLAIKFHSDGSNKTLIESLSKALEKAGIETLCFVRDVEEYSKKQFKSRELMKKAFKTIDSCDLLIIDLTEKGVGLGIEAGYAYAKEIPIITIAKKGSDISETLRGISKVIIFYTKPEDIVKELMNVVIRT